MQRTCEHLSQIEALLDGSVSIEQRNELEVHLSSCSICESKLEQLLDASKSTWDQLKHRVLQNADTDHQTAFDSNAPTVGTTLSSEIMLGLEQLGYSDVETIGHGGMGVVLTATQIHLNRRVAIKMLAHGVLSGPERVQRLRNEASAIGQLDHPHILKILALEEVAKLPCLVLEYADGQDLSKRLKEGPLVPKTAATFARQITSALSHAHDFSILHRDIKPANLLFQGDVLKVCDFGLAKLGDNGDDLTKSKLVGTPAYMAPEQTMESASIGPNTDVYAAGVVLYEMLCGVPPFFSRSLPETIERIKNEEPVPPRKLQPSIPRDLETICLKALCKAPQQRYSTAQQMHDDLTRFLEKRPILAKRPSQLEKIRKWCVRNPAIASLSAICLVSLLVLLLVWLQFTRDLAAKTKVAEEKTLVALQKSEEAANNLRNQLEANEATRQVLDFLTTKLLYSASPMAQGIDVTVIEMLRNAENELASIEGRPAVEAPIRYALGLTYMEIGEPVLAKPHALKAVDLYERFEGDLFDETDKIQGYGTLADILLTLGEFAPAQDALAKMKKMNLDVRQRLRADYALSDIRLRQGRLEEAESLLNQVTKEATAAFGEQDKLVLDTLAQTGVLHFLTGNFDSAKKTLHALIELQNQVYGPDSEPQANPYGTLAIAYSRSGDLTTAESLVRKSHEISKKHLGVDHVSTIRRRANLATALWRLKRKDEAIALQQDVVTGQMNAWGRDSFQALEAHYQLGRMLLDTEKFQQGVDHFNKYVEPLMSTQEADGQFTSLLTLYGRLCFGNAEIQRASNLATHVEELIALPGIVNESRKKRLQILQELLSSSDASQEAIQ